MAITIVECDFVHQAVCAHNSIAHIIQFAIVYMYVLWVTYAPLRKNTLLYVCLWSNPNFVSTFLTRDPILTISGDFGDISFFGISFLIKFVILYFRYREARLLHKIKFYFPCSEYL